MCVKRVYENLPGGYQQLKSSEILSIEITYFRCVPKFGAKLLNLRSAFCSSFKRASRFRAKGVSSDREVYDAT